MPKYMIIRAISTTKNKIHLALLPERKGAAVGVRNWPYYLGPAVIWGNTFTHFQLDTWLRGTSVRVNLIPHGTATSKSLLFPAHCSASTSADLGLQCHDAFSPFSPLLPQADGRGRIFFC